MYVNYPFVKISIIKVIETLETALLFNDLCLEVQAVNSNEKYPFMGQDISFSYYIKTMLRIRFIVLSYGAIQGPTYSWGLYNSMY